MYRRSHPRHLIQRTEFPSVELDGGDVAKCGTLAMIGYWGGPASDRPCVGVYWSASTQRITRQKVEGNAQKNDKKTRKNARNEAGNIQRQTHNTGCKNEMQCPQLCGGRYTRPPICIRVEAIRQRLKEASDAPTTGGPTVCIYGVWGAFSFVLTPQTSPPPQFTHAELF